MKDRFSTLAGLIDYYSNGKYTDDIEGQRFIVDWMNYIRGKDAVILMLRYGMFGTKKHTLREVAELFGRHPETIRKRQARAIRELQLVGREFYRGLIND